MESASQLTLVNPSGNAVTRALTAFSFLQDDMKNTEIYSADHRLLYTVRTDKNSDSHTMVYRSDSEDVVASIKRRTILSDTISFAHEPSRKLGKWLRAAGGRSSELPATFEWQNQNYTWRHDSGRKISLYAELDPETPIAWFRSPSRQTGSSTRGSSRAVLALQADGLGIVDGVVVSLLVVENNLRLRDLRIANGDGKVVFGMHYSADG